MPRVLQGEAVKLPGPFLPRPLASALHEYRHPCLAVEALTLADVELCPVGLVSLQNFGSEQVRSDHEHS